MPGPHGAWGQPLLDAVRAGVIEEKAIDPKVPRGSSAWPRGLAHSMGSPPPPPGRLCSPDGSKRS